MEAWEIEARGRVAAHQEAYARWRELSGDPGRSTARLRVEWELEQLHAQACQRPLFTLALALAEIDRLRAGWEAEPCPE